jgi:Transposase zinc-binding domain
MPFTPFDEFLEAYKERFQPRYGFLRPIILEVVEKFLECGDLARGFPRIQCDHCKEDRLLAFSCKGRWFCPSCHQKKVQLFGALLAESILYPVPHRHFVFGIPKTSPASSWPFTPSASIWTSTPTCTRW